MLENYLPLPIALMVLEGYRWGAALILLWSLLDDPVGYVLSLVMHEVYFWLMESLSDGKPVGPLLPRGV